MYSSCLIPQTVQKQQAPTVLLPCVTLGTTNSLEWSTSVHISKDTTVNWASYFHGKEPWLPEPSLKNGYAFCIHNKKGKKKVPEKLFQCFPINIPEYCGIASIALGSCNQLFIPIFFISGCYIDVFLWFSIFTFPYLGKLFFLNLWCIFMFLLEITSICNKSIFTKPAEYKNLSTRMGFTCFQNNYFTCLAVLVTAKLFPHI